MPNVRYGVLSDVHANLHALRAAFERLDGLGVNSYLFAGDAVGYGVFPNECVDMLRSRGAVCVAGNHDLMALGALGAEEASARAWDTVLWTRDRLTDDTRAFLRRLPLVAQIDGVTVAHGSLDDVSHYVQKAADARRELDRLPGPGVLVLGHTHLPWAFEYDNGTLLRAAPGVVALRAETRVLLNPGSVGQSRDRLPHVRFAVLDTDAGSAELHSVPYDLESCLRALHEEGRPAHAAHRPPQPVRDRYRAGLVLARRAAGRARRVVAVPFRSVRSRADER
ncbi:MAG TPA: metallophosphoesterase family protein [Actinomycetales bacterium]|nr:metallophosphoesterase family protein [Actinomycetales bacterium]